MKDVIYLNLKTTDGIKLFLRPSRFLKVKQELIDFLRNEKYLYTKAFVKTTMFSHELKANNQIEGYGDDVEIIEKVIAHAEDINDKDKRQRILNLYHGYNYILKTKEINQDTLKKLYSILSEGLLNSTDSVRMGKYYRTAPVYILKRGRLDVEPDQGVLAHEIDAYMNDYFAFLNQFLFVFDKIPIENYQKDFD